MASSPEFPQYRWVQPKSWTAGRITGQPTVVIIHTTEGSEGRTSAEDGAAYDARRTDGTSCHFFVDQDSTIQCVRTTDEAHAARRHGNDVGIQIEVCGKAGQTAEQWTDAASDGAVEQAAALSVALRVRWGKTRFPLVNLTPEQLRAGQRGFAEHLDATLAWPEDFGTHTDPGKNFPWSRLFARITELEQVVKRTVSFVEFTGRLPVLRYGDEDPAVAGDPTSYVRRVQKELNVAADGDYGPVTRDAVEALGLDGHDGTVVDLPVYIRLYALWGATVTGG